MSKSYYILPLLLSEVLKKKQLPTGDLVASISHNIHLMLLTQYGEDRFEPSYGCGIWEEDFENVYSNTAWQEKIGKDIKQAVAKHEPRLLNVQVTAIVTEEDFPPTTLNPGYRVKRRIDVRITGNLILTNEPFSFSKKLYVSPMAIDE